MDEKELAADSIEEPSYLVGTLRIVVAKAHCAS